MMNMQLHSSSLLVVPPLAIQFAKTVQDEAASRRLPILDATCPLVAKVHNHGKRYASKQRSILLICHAGHPEVEGNFGQINIEGIISALQARFTGVQGPDIRDICYATQNRQSAVRDLCKIVDIIIVVGATNSSNSNRLRAIGTETGVASYLIADDSELYPDWLTGVRTVGITAGASAPEVLVDDVIDALGRMGPLAVSVLPERKENIEFRLPAELASAKSSH